MNEQLIKKLDNIIRPVVKAMGYELWGVEVHQAGRHSLVRIYIDALAAAQKKNVGLDDCVKVNNQISALLDVEDPIKGQYTLEVSSPGLNRILFTDEQYKKFLGSLINLVLIKPEHGRKKFTGFLKSIDANNISIDVDGNIFVITKDNVKKSNVCNVNNSISTK